MLRTPHGTLLSLLLAVGSGSVATLAHADAQDVASSGGLDGARSALAHYDLAAPATYDALRTLGQVAASGGASAVEARFLRAYAGTDLYLAATLLGDGEARARLATALGVEEALLDAYLDGELAAAPPGPFRVAANEARATLTALRTGRGPRDVRRDAVVLLRAGADDDELARAVQASFEPGTSTRIELPFPADALRTVGRLAEAIQATRRIDRAAEQGEPLLALLRGHVDAVRERLARVRLQPVGIAGLDAVVTITPTEVRAGFVPTVSVDQQGAPVVSALGAPRLPEQSAQAVPRDLSVVPRALDPVTHDAMWSSVPSTLRIGLVLEGDVPSHLVVRTALALAQVHAQVTHLVVDGELVPVRFERSDDAQADVRVAVRLGGYVVERGRARSTEIPRVRVDGAFHFDVEALTRSVQGRSFTRAAVSAMPSIPARELFAAARAARRPDGVTLLTP